MRVRLFVPVLLVLSLLTAAGCGKGTSKPASALLFKSDGAPFAFSYPNGLTRQLASTGREFRGTPPRFHIAMGTDDVNVVVVAAYRLRRPVESYSAPAFRAFVDRAARTLARAGGVSVASEATSRLGGLPATTYALSPAADGRTQRLVFAFRGTSQYFVRCQWDLTGADAIGRACTDVQRSFRPVGR